MCHLTGQEIREISKNIEQTFMLRAETLSKMSIYKKPFYMCLKY